MHNLLNAHFDLRNFDQFDITLPQVSGLCQYGSLPKRTTISEYIPLSISVAPASTQHLMQGTFKQGLSVVPQIEKDLHDYELYVDTHRILVFNYKFATLHFRGR